MSTLLVSSKGQIVLPAELRRRLGMGAGARLEVIEESAEDGLVHGHGILLLGVGPPILPARDVRADAGGGDCAGHG